MMLQFKIHLTSEEFLGGKDKTEETEQTLGFEFSMDKTFCFSGQETVLKDEKILCSCVMGRFFKVWGSCLIKD